jgi:orotate phosphoribosyltransferase
VSIDIPAAAQPASTALIRRLHDVALVHEEFALADGGRLNSYFDEYQLAADPQLLSDVALGMAQLIPAPVQVLAGVELGGVPLAVALSAATRLPSAFLRRTAKPYGSHRQIEGAAVEGRRLVLVDDVVRTGRQLLHLAEILRAHGAIVSDALCVLERPLGGREKLARQGINLWALVTEAELHDAGDRT